ncbi:hypothetical protein EK21DRAFT_51272, partial [Setomelanomma holmii]
LRLVDTENVAKPLWYATLSHCWGPEGLPDQAKTTQEALELHKQEIRTEHLPRTFRDAIHATKGLGLEYLWIDALCIIQGSKADWIQEGIKLASIYANSTITLAAESARDSSEGLF